MGNTSTRLGGMQIGLRLDLKTAELLDAAAELEGISQLATYCRLALASHVSRNKTLPEEHLNRLLAGLITPNLKVQARRLGYLPAASLPVVASNQEAK